MSSTCVTEPAETLLAGSRPNINWQVDRPALMVPSFKNIMVNITDGLGGNDLSRFFLSTTNAQFQGNSIGQGYP